MTPKEKAEELVNRYFKLLNYEFGDEVYSLRDKQPHKCALIAVDELIKWDDACGGMSGYLIEVKEEINKL